METLKNALIVFLIGLFLIALGVGGKVYYDYRFNRPAEIKPIIIHDTIPGEPKIIKIRVQGKPYAVPETLWADPIIVHDTVPCGHEPFIGGIDTAFSFKDSSVSIRIPFFIEYAAFPDQMFADLRMEVDSAEIEYSQKPTPEPARNWLEIALGWVIGLLLGIVL